MQRAVCNVAAGIGLVGDVDQVAVENLVASVEVALNAHPTVAESLPLVVVTGAVLHFDVEAGQLLRID